MAQTKVYRVWMKDGYAGLYSATDETEAKAAAVQAARESVSELAMTASEKRKATTVDYTECLSS